MRRFDRITRRAPDGMMTVMVVKIGNRFVRVRRQKWLSYDPKHPQKPTLLLLLEPERRRSR